MTISFEQIPSSIRKPGKYFEFNTALAVRTLPANRQKMLIVGQKTAAGSVEAKVPTEVFSDLEAAAYFGAGSLAHLMAKAAIEANPYVALSVCALDDAAAGVAATGTLTVDGKASATGTLTLNVGNQSVRCGVTKDDEAAAVAAALKAAVDEATGLPVTASALEGVVTLTAKNKGTAGNTIPVSALASNSCAALTVTEMATGETDPDIADALSACFAGLYDIIATPYGDQTSLTALRAHLEEVSGPLEQRPGVGVYGYTGALADATTLAGQINSGRIVCAYVPGTRSLVCELAAAFASVMAFEEDPARPLNTLELKGIHVPAIEARLSRTEQESLLYNGVTPLEVGPGERLQIVRAITTYTLDAQGIPDISMLDVTTIRTLDYVRKACRERVALRFPREKLSSRTPKKVRSEILDVLLKLEELQIVEEVQANSGKLVVERSETDPNRLNAAIPADVVNGLHVFAGRIDLLL